MGRTLLALAALGVTLGLAGCTGSPAAPTPSPSPADGGSVSAAAPSSGTASAEPSAGASPSLATLPASECLRGTWRLVRFVAASSETYGTGQGGDVTVRFTDDGYTLAGSGKKPVEVTLAGRTADLTVDGRATGSYALDGSKATFTDGPASGSATVRLGEQSQRLTMDQVTSVIGLKGEGQVACTAEAMTITLAAVRLELART